MKNFKNLVMAVVILMGFIGLNMQSARAEREYNTAYSQWRNAEVIREGFPPYPRLRVERNMESDKLDFCPIQEEYKHVCKIESRFTVDEDFIEICAMNYCRRHENLPLTYVFVDAVIEEDAISKWNIEEWLSNVENNTLIFLGDCTLRDNNGYEYLIDLSTIEMLLNKYYNIHAIELECYHINPKFIIEDKECPEGK